MACKINQSEASIVVNNNNNNNTANHEKEENPRMEITFEESALMKEVKYNKSIICMKIKRFL